ncbi:MAG: hypothetical protein JXR83_11660 [Deltaproteobacteria bacterium]|nr:hypothetical protein [Deltaproteobacteria bacterium]
MRRYLWGWGALLLCASAAPIALAQTSSAPASQQAASQQAGSRPEASSPPATETAGEPRAVRIAVPNMVATGDDVALAKTLTEVLTIEVAKTKGIEAIGMADIEALLSHEQQKTLLGCEDASCIAEIGGALGVDALLSSKVGRVGDTYVLSIRLNDTRTARQIGSAYETVSGKPEDLIRVVQRKVPEVMKNVLPEPAVAAAASSAPPTGGGARDKTPAFHIVWPAVGVAFVGGLALIASGGLATVSYFSFEDGDSYAKIMANRHVYYEPGAQEPFDKGKTLALAAIIAATVGATAIVGASAWQIMGGFAEKEEAAP